MHPLRGCRSHRGLLRPHPLRLPTVTTRSPADLRRGHEESHRLPFVAITLTPPRRRRRKTTNTSTATTTTMIASYQPADRTHPRSSVPVPACPQLVAPVPVLTAGSRLQAGAGASRPDPPPLRSESGSWRGHRGRGDVALQPRGKQRPAPRRHGRPGLRRDRPGRNLQSLAVRPTASDIARALSQDEQT